MCRHFPNSAPNTDEAPTAPQASARRTFVRPTPNAAALGFRVAELRALGGPARTTTYALIKSGRLIARKIGATTIIDGDSFRALMRGKT